MTRTSILKLAFVGYVLLTILVSIAPSNQEIPLRNIDKIGHFLAYGGLALLACLAFPSRSGRILALLFSLSLGAVLEGVQATVPGRDMSGWDALANSLGILTGIIIFYFQGEKLKEWLHI